MKYLNDHEAANYEEFYNEISINFIYQKEIVPRNISLD